MIGVYKEIKAEYCDESLLAPRNRGNPCISALPWAGHSIDQILKSFQYLPAPPSTSDLLLSDLQRISQLFELSDLVYRRAEYKNAISAAVTVLSETYVARNIVTEEDHRRRTLLHQTPPGATRLLLPANWRSTAKGLGFFGPSGSGKTTFGKRFCLPFSVVIIHTNYRGTQLSQKQVPVLYIQIPYDANLKSLCVAFFATVDAILGNGGFYEKQGRNAGSIPLMVALIARVGNAICLGVLFVDEVHNLRVAKGPKIVEMLNLFSQLMEQAGISVYVAGVPSVKAMLQPTTPNQRKLVTAGEHNFGLMALDDPEFIDFTDLLWSRKMVRMQNRLTPGIRKVWHERSAGNPAFIVLLFMLTQRNEIGVTEEVNELTLAMAAEENMATLQPAIRALRIGGAAAMDAYDTMKVQKIVDAILTEMNLPPTNILAYRTDGTPDFPEIGDDDSNNEPPAAAQDRPKRQLSTRADQASDSPLPDPENPLLLL
jgi:hypothetical protein